MNIGEIRTLFDFDHWANRKILEACRSLKPNDLTRDLHTSHQSIAGTLVHIMWSEWIWLRRWEGESPKKVFATEEFPSISAIQKKWDDIERGQNALIGRLRPELLAATLSYENLQGQRWEYSLERMMQHVVNHSSYHRGQVVTMLRQLGQAAPSTDFLIFFDEGAPAARA